MMQEQLRRQLDTIRQLLAKALGRSRSDKGIGRTSAAVLTIAVFCTGLASFTYFRASLVRDRTAVLEAELERRTQQLTTSFRASSQITRALAARSHTARAMRTYQFGSISVMERTSALMALQLVASNLVEAGGLRAVELRSLEGDRITSAGSLAHLPRLSVPVFHGTDELYWDEGFVLRLSVPITGEDGVAGTMVVDMRVLDADTAITGTARLGETGEVGLCGLSGSSKICFPSRFQPAGSVKTLIQPVTLPTDRALSGQRGTMQVVDYRNQLTYAAFQPIDDLGLAIVVKADEAELLAPITRQIMLGIPALLLLALGGSALTGRQLKPLTDELVSARSRADAEVVSRTLVEAEIRLAKRQLQLVADNASFLIAFLDPHYVFRFANRAHTQWLQRPLEQIVGQSMENLVGQEVWSEYLPAIEAAFATRAPQIVFRERLSGGVSRFMEVTFVAQLDEDEELEGYCITARDATEGFVREQSLLLAARRDPLTGLCNRTSFNERLEQELKSVELDSRSLAVAYLDVDYFKRVNDRFGHDVGDIFLKELGQRIEGALMHSDTVARLGGDEFAIIMRLAAPRDVRVVGSRLLASIRQTLTIGGHVIQPSASLGFAVARPDDTALTLLKRADVALYEAKSRGRDGVFHSENDRVPEQTM